MKNHVYSIYSFVTFSGDRKEKNIFSYLLISKDSLKVMQGTNNTVVEGTANAKVPKVKKKAGAGGEVVNPKD